MLRASSLSDRMGRQQAIFRYVPNTQNQPGQLGCCCRPALAKRGLSDPGFFHWTSFSCCKGLFKAKCSKAHGTILTLSGAHKCADEGGTTALFVIPLLTRVAGTPDPVCRDVRLVFLEAAR